MSQALSESARAVLYWSNAIQPVVAGNKIPSGIANDRHSELTDLVENVFTKSVSIRELRSRIVDALVDGAPQMFQERAEQIAIERRDGSTGININPRSGSRAC